MKKNYLAIGILSIATLASCKKDLLSDQALQNDLNSPLQRNAGVPGNPGQNYVPNELLVKFKKGIPEDVKSRV